MFVPRWRISCALLVLGLHVSYKPAFAADSSPLAPPPADTGVRRDGPIQRSLPAIFDAASHAPRYPGRIVHHCCNPKGAIIGAAVGAAAGWWFTFRLCDAGDCSAEYIQSMAALGGIGALLGAFVDRDHTSLPPRQTRRVRVGMVVTPRTRGAVTVVRF
jgi:hypothetical protein